MFLFGDALGDCNIVCILQGWRRILCKVNFSYLLVCKTNLRFDVIENLLCSQRLASYTRNFVIFQGLPQKRSRYSTWLEGKYVHLSLALALYCISLLIPSFFSLLMLHRVASLAFLIWAFFIFELDFLCCSFCYTCCFVDFLCRFGRLKDGFSRFLALAYF